MRRPDDDLDATSIEPHARSADSRPWRPRSPSCPDRSATPPRMGRTRSLAAARSPRTRTFGSAGEPARSRRRPSRPAIKAAAADANATRASKAATFTYDAGRLQPDRLRVGATCGVNGLACFTRTRPRPASRCGCASRVMSSTGARSSGARRTPSPPNGCYDAETIALDEFGHVEGLEPPRQLRRRLGLPRRRRPDLLADQAVGRLEHAHVRPLRRRDRSSSSTTCRRGPRSTRPAWTWPPTLTLSASSTAVAHRRHDDADRDAQGRRLRRRTGGSGGNPVTGRTVTLQRRAPGATTWATVGTMPAGLPRRHLRP